MSNAGRSLVLDAQGNSRRAIAKILGLSEISVGVYCRQLRKELGKLTIAEEILSVLASE